MFTEIVLAQKEGAAALFCWIGGRTQQSKQLSNGQEDHHSGPSNSSEGWLIQIHICEKKTLDWQLSENRPKMNQQE